MDVVLVDMHPEADGQKDVVGSGMQPTLLGAASWIDTPAPLHRPALQVVAEAVVAEAALPFHKRP